MVRLVGRAAELSSTGPSVYTCHSPLIPTEPKLELGTVLNEAEMVLFASRALLTQKLKVYCLPKVSLPVMSLVMVPLPTPESSEWPKAENLVELGGLPAIGAEAIAGRLIHIEC